MRWVLLLAPIFFSGCATDLLHHASESTALQQYEVATISFRVNLPGIPEEKETVADKIRLTELWAGGVHLCGQTFLSALAGGNLSSALAIYDEYSKYQDCATRYGVTSEAFAEMPDGRLLDFPAYLQEFEMAAAHLVRVEAQNREHKSTEFRDFLKTFALIWSGSNYHAPNPNILMVSPHITSRGKYVVPHIRTAPNQYCVDNLRGCR